MHQKSCDRNTSTDRDKIAASYFARLDVPNCGCRRDPLPCPCREFREKGKCSCPVILPDPCEHILARDHDLPLDEWGGLLHFHYPDKYGEPLEAPPIDDALPQSKAKVERMRERVALGFSAFNDDDIKHQKDKKTKRVAKHYGNGADYNIYVSEESDGSSGNGTAKNTTSGLGQDHGRPKVSGARVDSTANGG